MREKIFFRPEKEGKASILRKKERDFMRNYGFFRPEWIASVSLGRRLFHSSCFLRAFFQTAECSDVFKKKIPGSE